jgi:hypothetical protein
VRRRLFLIGRRTAQPKVSFTADGSDPTSDLPSLHAMQELPQDLHITLWFIVHGEVAAIL